jgi:hypothetical protein
VAQVVEHLLCQGEDLSSNFSPTKNKKERVSGQLELHSETLSQNKQTKTNPQTTTNLLYVCNKFKH